MSLIKLRTCVCPHCKGRGAACMAGFDWLDRQAPDHALEHAKQDMRVWFDRKVPPLVRLALNEADVNICAWCATMWANEYGQAQAAQLVRNARFVNDTIVVTGIRHGS